jgi:hypothetical protein
MDRDLESGLLEDGEGERESCKWYLPSIGFLAALLLIILFVSLHFGGLL